MTEADEEQFYLELKAFCVKWRCEFFAHAIYEEAYARFGGYPKDRDLPVELSPRAAAATSINQ